MFYLNEGQPISNPTLICKHCKVPVVGRLDLRAVLGKEHLRGCPRRKWEPNKKS